MKKIILSIALTFSIALPLATTTQAATESVPDGFYLLEAGTSYVSVDNFLYSNLQQKVTLLTENYYLILGGSAIKASDILLPTDKEVDSKITTQAEIEEKFGIEINSQGTVKEAFRVMSIE